MRRIAIHWLDSLAEWAHAPIPVVRGTGVERQSLGRVSIVDDVHVLSLRIDLQD